MQLGSGEAGFNTDNISSDSYLPHYTATDSYEEEEATHVVGPLSRSIND